MRRRIVPKLDNPKVYNARRHHEGDAFTYTIDCDPECTRLSNTLSSATWTVEQGDATVSGETSVSDNAVTALITTSDCGYSQIKVALVFDDNQKFIQWINVYAKDPENGRDKRYPE